jgi:hypothetical protein
MNQVFKHEERSYENGYFDNMYYEILNKFKKSKNIVFF